MRSDETDQDPRFVGFIHDLSRKALRVFLKGDANNKATIARIVADNEAKVNALKIAAQEQRVKITQQEAQIRREEASGIRDAQTTIASSITPLYVQLEMVKVLKDIAADGKNNTVIYIPVGPDGLPVMAQAVPPVMSSTSGD